MTSLQIKIGNMSSKAPPPLIRSSKAFSVEIPEGSNSAKARRSDIVANDELDLQHKSSNFDVENKLTSKADHFKEDLPDSSFTHVEQGPSHADASAFQEQHDDLKDRFGPGEDHGQAQDTLVMGAADGYAIRLGPGGDSIVPDNHQGLTNDAFHDNHQGLTNEAIKDRSLGIANDAIEDRQVVLPSDILEDTHTSLPDDKLSNEHAVAPDQSVYDHTQDLGTDKEHLEDRHVALPDTDHKLKDGPQPASSAAASTDRVLKSSLNAVDTHRPMPATGHTGHTAHPMHEADAESAHLAQMDKEKRLEEFHGRVEALRKTVSGINHKLDEIDHDHPPKSKH